MRFAWGVLAVFVLRRFTAVTFGSIGWPLRVFGIIGLSIAIRVTWLARLRATVLALLLIPGPRFLSLGRLDQPAVGDRVGQIGRAHVCTPVTNAHLVCRLLLEKKKSQNNHTVQ